MLLCPAAATQSFQNVHSYMPPVLHLDNLVPLLYHVHDLAQSFKIDVAQPMAMVLSHPALESLALVEPSNLAVLLQLVKLRSSYKITSGLRVKENIRALFVGAAFKEFNYGGEIWVVRGLWKVKGWPASEVPYAIPYLSRMKVPLLSR